MNDFTFTGFYRAIVTNNLDNLEAGRVQVRVMPMFKDIEDAALPWATMADASFGGIDSGFCNIPEIGSVVFIFFENNDIRYPVYFASAPAIHNNKPDLPQSMRDGGDIVNQINSNRKQNVQTASGSVWTEPGSAYNATYPNNTVIQSKSGIMIEMDDTTDNLRMHFYHPSGTHQEIDNNGNKVDHITNDGYTVILGYQKNYVGQNSDTTVDGDMSIKSLTLKIVTTNNVTIESGGDVNVTGTNINATATGNVAITGSLITLN